MARRLSTAREVARAKADPRFVAAVAANPRNIRWRDAALCRGYDPEIWAPMPSEPVDYALSICGRCSSAANCLRWALESNEQEGVVGGTTWQERRAMLVAWRQRETRAAS